MKRNSGARLSPVMAYYPGVSNSTHTITALKASTKPILFYRTTRLAVSRRLLPAVAPPDAEKSRPNRSPFEGALKGLRSQEQEQEQEQEQKQEQEHTHEQEHKTVPPNANDTMKNGRS